MSSNATCVSQIEIGKRTGLLWSLIAIALVLDVDPRDQIQDGRIPPPAAACYTPLAPGGLPA